MRGGIASTSIRHTCRLCFETVTCPSLHKCKLSNIARGIVIGDELFENRPGHNRRRARGDVLAASPPLFVIEHSARESDIEECAEIWSYCMYVSVASSKCNRAWVHPRAARREVSANTPPNMNKQIWKIIQHCNRVLTSEASKTK